MLTQRLPIILPRALSARKWRGKRSRVPSASEWRAGDLPLFRARSLKLCITKRCETQSKSSETSAVRQSRSVAVQQEDDDHGEPNRQLTDNASEVSEQCPPAR